MAADDPNEKSLFCRIKDCVLTELNRSKNEVKRTKCPSRSMWIWDIEKNSTPAEKTETPKVEEEPPKKEISRSVEDKKGESTSENKDERLRGGHGIVKRHVEENETTLQHKEHLGKYENVEKGGKKVETHIEKTREHEQPTRSVDDKHEKNKKTADNHRNSCDAMKFKPVRYYIKMQDPEAPPCCVARKSRKICPPKTKKYQQETRSYCPSRPTCRCEGCVAEFNENRYSKN